jgi:hypothetical protein
VEGYSAQRPFHGYYFKTLTGQGPAARLDALGEGTATIAPAIDRYDPDATWKRTDDAH